MVLLSRVGMVYSHPRGRKNTFEASLPTQQQQQQQRRPRRVPSKDGRVRAHEQQPLVPKCRDNVASHQHQHFHFDGFFFCLSVLAEKRAAYLLPTAAARKQVRNAHGRATSRTNRLIHRSSQPHASSKSGAFAPARRFKGPRRREKHVASARARFLTGLLI